MRVRLVPYLQGIMEVYVTIQNSRKNTVGSQIAMGRFKDCLFRCSLKWPTGKGYLPLVVATDCHR